MPTCDMGPRALTSPRLLIFAIIAGCYFLITVHITNNLSTGSCDNPPQGAFETAPENNDRIIYLNKPYINDEGEETAARRTHVAPKTPVLAPRLKSKVSRKDAEEPREQLYIPDTHSHVELLNTDLATNMVYMVWCGRRWFEFNHYLSALSAIKHLRPDNIFFYYNYHPIRDEWIYNTWIEELKTSYPFFHLEPVREEDHACAGHGQPNITFINKLLTITGGIYLNEQTILMDYPLRLRKKDYIFALQPGQMTGFISAKRGLPGKIPANQLLKNSKLNTLKLNCVDYKKYTTSGNPVCMTVSERFFPKDIWVANSDFANAMRTLFYGSPEPKDAKPSYDELIPNIAHIVWIGGGEMDYLFYLGVLSLIYVAEVDMVYLHGNAPPTGPLWERIKDHQKITIIYREAPRTVYNQNVHIISHVTDVWRVDFMVRYGGIYVDTDTVFVKKLDHAIRGYDAVGSYDWTYWNHPFPDTINFGVSIGKRNAKFWQEFQKSMKWFIDHDWAWNGLRQPYKIKERQPELLKINPHLQVICYKYLCHPTWWPDYHNESVHHMNSPSIKDWKNDAYAFHWTLPTPPELDDEKLLLTSTSMAAEVGRYVLEKAGILTKLKRQHGINR